LKIAMSFIGILMLLRWIFIDIEIGTLEFSIIVGILAIYLTTEIIDYFKTMRRKGY
jgi:hypothetical protein